jgi:hypothetical protein
MHYNSAKRTLQVRPIAMFRSRTLYRSVNEPCRKRQVILPSHSSFSAITIMWQGHIRIERKLCRLSGAKGDTVKEKVLS